MKTQREGARPQEAEQLGRRAARSTGSASQGDRVYRTLKTHMMMGEFAPNVRLAEERLAALVDSSRTPVREALKRLQAEGLVGRHPDGGYEPIVPDVTVVRHLYEVRAGLELQALQRPTRHGGRHDPAVLEPLRDQWASLAAGPLPDPDPNFVLLDESFHIALMTAAGNDVAVGFLRQVNDRIRQVRMYDFLSSRRIEATIGEHLSIVERVLAGDVLDAELAFSQHLGDSMSFVEERVRTAIVRMITGGSW